jgi:hypothetical protein
MIRPTLILKSDSYMIVRVVQRQMHNFDNSFRDFVCAILKSVNFRDCACGRPDARKTNILISPILNLNLHIIRMSW